MLARFWIAHILAVHLNIPEAVDFQMYNLWPTKDDAQMHWVIDKRTWEVRYDIDAWYSHNEFQKKYVIAHELCHGVYEYNVDWGKLSKKEQRDRHKIVEECAKKIMRDHKKCNWE